MQRRCNNDSDPPDRRGYPGHNTRFVPPAMSTAIRQADALQITTAKGAL